MGSVGAPWLVFVAVATWRSLHDNPGQLPRPAVYAGSAIIYSGLALLAQSERARQPVAAFAWALVVAQAVTGKLLEPNAAVLAPGTGSNTKSDVAKIKAQTAAAVSLSRKQGGRTSVKKTSTGTAKTQRGAH